MPAPKVVSTVKISVVDEKLAITPSIYFVGSLEYAARIRLPAPNADAADVKFVVNVLLPVPINTAVELVRV